MDESTRSRTPGPVAAAPAPPPASRPMPSPEPAPLEMDSPSSGGAAGFGGPSGNFGSGAGAIGRLGMSVPSGNVQIGPTQVSGGLPSEVVIRVLRQSIGRLRNCYQMGLQRNPGLTGTINVSFVIGQGGGVVAVRDAGRSIGDMNVVSCVLNTVRSIAFPSPAASFVTVNVAMNFRPQETSIASHHWMPPTEPTAVHRAADDTWLTKGEDIVSKLRAALDQNPSSRKRYEDLVRGLLARGRFDEALSTARRFVSMDPDLPVARELLAYAAVTNDDAPLAAASIDTQTETDPTSVKWHVRGARAFEALGDERRACAHWRSLAELSPKSDEFAYEAFRCRARILDDRDALGDLRSLGRSSRILGDLASQLEAGKPPPFAKTVAGAGQFEVEMNCFSGERCPTVFVVSPLGNVFSPFTPTDARSSAKSVAFSGLRDATYMTLLAGGSPDARGELEIRTYGSVKKFPISHGGKQTVASTRVTLPVARPGFRATDGFAIAF